MDSLPLLRLPFRRAAGGGDWRTYRTCLFDDILGITGFEVPKAVKVQSTALGILKFLLMLLVVSWYLVWYGVYVEKQYLTTASIDGVGRMQLQHPTKGCNPLHESCLSRFKKYDELPYCSQNKDNQNKKVSGIKDCVYLDEFDVENGAFQSNQILIPTRISTIEQTLICDGADEPCARRYSMSERSNKFVADIERFTLLIDHSFACEELDIKKHAWQMQGFLRPCGPPHDCQLIPIDPHPHFKEDYPVTQTWQKKLRHWWLAGDPVDQSDAFGLPNGDVFRVGFLMEMLNIKMDKPYNFKNETQREEGVSIMLEIIYTNYKPYTRPNLMPPAYEYRFSTASFETYKATETIHAPNENFRVVKDVHGIYIRSRMTGKMGTFSAKQTLLMVLEASLLLSVVRWFITLLALNVWTGARGDKLEKAMAEDIEFQVLEGGDIFAPLMQAVEEVVGSARDASTAHGTTGAE